MTESPDLTSRQLEILDTLRGWRDDDAPTHGGRVLSYVYDPARGDVDALAAAAASEVQPVNGLDPLTFTSVAHLERELVTFGREILHGPDAVGSVTSGGTESCLLAVKAARDLARRNGLPAGSGTIVLPTTAHAAFLKAASLFDLAVRRVPVDPVTTAVHAEDVRAAIDDVAASGGSVVLTVASAPNYPTGALDPVADIAEVTAPHGIPLHVDACLGGLVLPYWPDDLPPWDFRVDGVTSISADTHKYGYAPKGTSLLLHRSADTHLGQFFATADWPGYPIVNPTLLGSRSAAGMASAWAVSKDLHPEGYRTLTSSIASTVAELRSTVADIPGLRVVGDPTGPVFAVTADDGDGADGDAAAAAVHPHLWADAVQRRGFVLQLQPSYTQPDGTTLPASTHLTVTPATEGVLPDLRDALVAAADEVRGQDVAAPDPSEIAALMADADAGAPDMVAVLAALEQLPKDLAADLLTRYLEEFTRP